MISNNEIDLVVNLPISAMHDHRHHYLARRTAVDFGVPLLTNPQLFKMFTEALKKNNEGKIQFLKVTQ